jgi:hypothetical protein
LFFWFFSRKSLSKNLLYKRCLQLSIYAWILSFRMKHWQESLLLLAVIVITFIIFRVLYILKVPKTGRRIST